MPNSLRLRLPEVVIPGKRLGRNLRHDPRSLRYAAPESAPASASWAARIPILDQGNLGSCVGNAFTGCLGTEPFFDTVPQGVKLDEAFAVKVYSLATQLDDYPGQYPPQDDGTDGLAGAKAVQQDGLASGYTHGLSVAGCYTMIKAGPFALGVSWHTGMDTPTSEGVVHATGQVRGGHEVCAVAYDATKGLWKVRNSWGDSWGRDGYFLLPDEDLSKLLGEQGDATQLVPVNQPAPTPAPPPAPGPDAFPAGAYETFRAAWETWRPHTRSRGKTAAVEAGGDALVAALDAYLMRG